jgi:hypothetical protein
VVADVKIIDIAGTLELSDTGRRCTNLSAVAGHDGAIVRVRCPKCEESQELGMNLAAFFWATKKADKGFHLGCADAEIRARWEDAHQATVDWDTIQSPPGACPICHRLDCGGAVT